MSKLLRTLGITLILGISIFSVGCGSTNSTKNTTSSTKETTANKNTDEEKTIKLDKENAISIGYETDDFKDIMNLFKTNELQAKDKYLNKTLKINAEVIKISTKNEKIIVHVSTKDRSYGTDLQFEDTKENEDKIKNLKVYDDSKGAANVTRGDVITAYGYFEDFDSNSGSTGTHMKVTYCEF